MTFSSKRQRYYTMNLTWLQYQKGTKAQYYLMLMVLEGDDRYVGLMSDAISDHDISLIRKNLKFLDEANNNDKINWLKTNISTYNKAYREFMKAHARVDQTMALTPMGVKEAKE